MIMALIYRDFPTPFGKREKQKNKPPTPLNQKKEKGKWNPIPSNP
jgi:hypothetical protein